MKRVEQVIWCLCVALAACILWQSPIGDTLLAQPGGGIEVRKRDSNWITDFGGNAADGADGSDDTAFANLIAARIAVQQYDAFLPPGVWNVSDKVSLPAGFVLSGAGETTVIEMASGMAEAALAGHARTVIRDLKITGPGYATAGSRGIEIIGGGGADYRSRWKIQNVTVTQCADAFYLDYSGVGDIISPFVTICGNGLHTAGTFVNVINVFGGEIHNCTNGVLAETDSGNVLNIWGSTIEGNTAYGVLLDNSANGVRNVSIKGCYFESNTTAHVRSMSDNLVTNLTIEDNYFLNSASAVVLDKCQVGRIVNNSFQVSSFTTQKAITLGASCRFVKVGVNRYQPTGSLLYSPATDDTGFGNTFDPDPVSFWALGDGSNDDTAELQAWLDANPVHCHLPAGTYIVSGELSMTADQLLTGDGMNKCIIKAAAGYAGKILRPNDRCTIRDIGLQGVLVSGSIGTEPLASAFGITFERVQIRSFDYGAKLDNANEDISFLDCYVRLNAIDGILLSSTSGTPDRVTVRDSRFDSNGVGIHASGAGRALNITGNSFVGHTTYGVYFEGQVQGAVIQGNRASNNGTADFRLAGTSRGLTVASNRCETTPTSFLLACLDSTFIDNVLSPGGMTPATITIGSSSENEFGQNRFAAGTPANGPALVSGTRNTYLGSYYGNAAPAAGTWLTGDVVWDISPTSGSAGSFICTAAGSPGTWTNGPSVP